MPDPCLNCAAPLPEPRPRFCGACGQETNIKPPTLGEFAQQFGGAYFSTEGALWRTLALLLLKPGELTRRYLAGQRKRYVLPLRLYLTVSLLTLLALRLVTPFDMNLNVGNAQGRGGREAATLAPDKPPTFTIIEIGDGARVGMKEGRFFCEKLPQWVCARLQSRLDLDAKGLAREMQRWPERFVSTCGTAMFLLVPFFALLHKLVYFGRGLRYTEHLVFALHVHTFWFGAIALSLLPVKGLGFFAALAMPVHGLLAARRVYGGGWFGTVARALVVAFLYGVTLAIALSLAALWAFFVA